MAIHRRLPDGTMPAVGVHEWESADAGLECGEIWRLPSSEKVWQCRGSGLHICEPLVKAVEYHTEIGMILARGAQEEIPKDCEWQRTAAVRLLATRLWSDDAEGYVRRYNRCDIRIPRKNGKTWLMQLLVSWFLTNSEGILIAVAAQTKETAQDAIWHWMRQVGKLSVACQEKMVIVPAAKDANIRNPSNHSEVVLVTAEGDKLRGPEYQLAVLDEVMAIAGARDWLDNASAGQSALDEPLIVTATTASGDPESFESERFLELLLIEEDPDREPETLPLLWHLPEGADWTDEDLWFEANPALGSVKKLAQMRKRFAKARGNPDDERAFRREELNEIVDELASGAVDLERWEKCGEDPDSREGCWELIGAAEFVFCGVDLSWGNDLSSAAFLARVGDDRLLPLWQQSGMMESKARELDDATAGLVRKWVRAGVLEIVPDSSFAKDGDFVDWVARRILELIHRRPNKSVDVLGYDPALAQPAVDVWETASVNAVKVLQGPYLNDAIAKLTDDVQGYRVRHGGDELLTHAVTRAAITRTGIRDFRQINNLQ